MNESSQRHATFRLPILQGILPIKSSQVPAEIIAGLTLAALAVPEVMGYTKISGTPVITGLYTILIPMARYLSQMASADRQDTQAAKHTSERLQDRQLLGPMTLQKGDYSRVNIDRQHSSSFAGLHGASGREK